MPSFLPSLMGVGMLGFFFLGGGGVWLVGFKGYARCGPLASSYQKLHKNVESPSI